MGFGKNKAKLLAGDQSQPILTMAGVDEAKEDVSELVEFLSDPTKFQRLGADSQGCFNGRPSRNG